MTISSFVSRPRTSKAKEDGDQSYNTSTRHYIMLLAEKSQFNG
jgi:hypothetical protein